jgi:hypothetical protein
MLSNYIGYDPQLSVPRSYDTMLGFYGSADWDWLRKTGCQFVIYDATAYNKYRKEINQFADPKTKMTLANGETIVKFKENFPQYASGFNHNVFDNGYIQVLYTEKKPIVSGFKVIQGSQISFKIQVLDNRTRIAIPFFPNRHFHLRLIGDPHFGKVPLHLDNGIYYHDLSQGIYHIKIYYENRLLTIFLWLFCFYWIICLGTILKLFIQLLATKKAVLSGSSSQ